MEHRDLVRGAAEVEETPEGVRPSRMTAEALELCCEHEEAGIQAQFTAGVRIALVTDSSELALTVTPVHAESVRDYQIDVMIDRSECHTFSPEDPAEEFSFSIELSDSDDEHEVEILLPTAAAVDINSLELTDGALFRPIYCSDERMLFIGGASIMGQGAGSPLRSFAALLGAQSGNDYINWGVGGMPVSAELGELALELEWQKVLVCCDAGDFLSGRSADESGVALAALLDHLTARPGVAVYVMTPLLFPGHEDMSNEAGCRIRDFRVEIRRVVDSFPGVSLIDGAALLSDDEDLFYGGNGDPSDEGMAVISEKLFSIIS